MTRDEARAVLVKACCEDYVHAMMNDNHFRWEVAEFGFVGFANMSDADLVKCVTDGELDDPDYDEDGDIRAAIETLQAPA